jgi:two-component system CheB/CheR fusion protein
MPQPEPHYIIAIGASAGGMEEIHRFFDNTPLDSVSYVIVQHLSPDFKSRMVELLANHSKLKVTEAEQNMLVKPNEVYLIPSKKIMTICEGRLQLIEKPKTSKPLLTVNTFFNSLAAERGNKAIAIILSGTGTDGSEGVKAIKEAGGMVIVSNPDHAEYNGMPASAVATGMADFILNVESMPQTITDYVNNNGKTREVKKIENEEKYVTAIIDLIKENLPLDFSEYKANTILRRIKRRAAYHDFDLLENYLALLKTDAAEVEALAHDFLISVTSFFRDKDAFEFIETHVIPDIIKQAVTTGKEIKMWVTGCATGEEAYSLAIILKEQLDDRHKNISVKIFATDIDSAALALAGKGLYNESITKDVSPQRIERFFSKENNEYRIKPDIRRTLIFAQHDITKNAPYCNMNLISCRNLLIYLTPVLQKKIFLMLQFGLKKDGYLFLGSSENVSPLNHGLQLINSKWKIYKNIESKRAALFDTFSLPAFADVKPIASNNGINDNYDIKKNDLHELLNEAITHDLGYTVICVDENNQVIKTFGDTAKYFLQKNFNLNLTDLLPAPLAIAYNTASRYALHSDEGAVIKGIKIKNNGQLHIVNLQVKPLPAKKGGLKVLYVLINEDNSAISSPEKDTVFNEEIYRYQYNTSLEQELRDVKERLQLTSDNLDASIENMQSFNEELLSANEEMQSTNEEMQSVNEELQTINSDYQLKNKELAEINDDLNNYFRSNLNGQLFVNTDLLLMKFSPGTVKHINLLNTDIGRPLSNISTNLRFETIENDIKEVIANGGVITKEVEATNGKSYQLMTMPYVRQANNTTEGAIITFNDITELKKIQRSLDETNKNLIRVNGDLDNFVHTASHDLLGPLGNIEVSISMLTSTDCASDSEVKEYLIVINESIKKFKILVKEMATIGKIESQMSETEPVDLNEIINEIKLSIANRIMLSKAVITTDLHVIEIHFSKKNLRSLLYNLITNAIKYKSNNREPVITISTKKTNNYVLLSVRDNGNGIAKDKLEKIFNIYGRVQTDVEGQGIGLYLAKKIVDAAGGRIDVDSEPGTGSTFNIYFKVEKESAFTAGNAQDAISMN